MRGHVGPDDNIQGSRTDIRPPAEIEEWRRRDPIAQFGKVLRDRGIAREETLSTMKKEVEEEVEAAIALARRAPFPPPEELHSNVLA
jgi:TPP-dependent pyruvate/acetoin dehydrogenase alpha subunit